MASRPCAAGGAAGPASACSNATRPCSPARATKSARHLDGPGVAVGAADDGFRARRRQALHPGAAPLARLGDQRVPEDLLVAAPAQKAERRRGGPGVLARAAARLRAQQARGDVGRDERRLDGQRARPAQRVQQAGAGGGVTRPGRVQQHAGGEVLLERRLDLHLVGAVPAPVQALPAQVDRDGHARAREVRVHAHVRRARIDRGTGAARGAELVHDRVLDAHGAEARVPDAVVDSGEVDRQGVAGAEVLAPVDAAGRVAYSWSPSAACPLASGSRTRPPTRDHRQVRYAVSSEPEKATPARTCFTCAAPNPRSSPASSDSRPRGTVAKRGRSVITQGYHAADRDPLSPVTRPPAADGAGLRT